MFLSLWTPAGQFPRLTLAPPPQGPANSPVPCRRARSDLPWQAALGGAEPPGSSCTHMWPSSHFQVLAYQHPRVPQDRLCGHSGLSWGYTVQGKQGSDFKRENSLEPSLRSHEHVSKGHVSQYVGGEIISPLDQHLSFTIVIAFLCTSLSYWMVHSLKVG